MCEGARCGAGVCCSTGVCCGSDADCPARQDCTEPARCSGTRTDRACRDSHCIDVAVVPDDEACAGQLARACGEYADVRCQPGQPPSPCADRCRSQDDCRAGNACVAGGCQRGCRDDAQCDALNACLGGACLRLCSPEQPCPTPRMCTAMLDPRSTPERTLRVCLDL